MSTWALIQIVFNIFAALGLFIVVMKMNRQPKDDPRMSRGLQLLTSKIAVLEDLSDRTETQVNQLVALLEQKAREVQAKVQLAEQHVHAIRVSMDRSLEVAKIFQDKIPHQEIIERQNTIKYVQAARLAHQGLGLEEISRQVDLPKGELEFIAKVNRDRLMFSEDELPDWAREAGREASRDSSKNPSRDSYQESSRTMSEETHSEFRAQAATHARSANGHASGVSADGGYMMIEPPDSEFESSHSDHSNMSSHSASSVHTELSAQTVQSAGMTHSTFMNYANSTSSLSHLSFAENVDRRTEAQYTAPETASTAEIEQDATRLRAEMELAERQRLVENLSRLQTEMQALDKELAREASVRDLSGAFEVPKVETASLQRLGEEFRKACEQAQQMGEKSSIFPPLEHLSSLLQPAFESLSKPAEIILPSIPAAVAAAFQSKLGASQAASMTNVSEAGAARQESVQDQALKRAAAQAKVQAALKVGEVNTRMAASGEVPAELTAAREVAKQVAAVVAAPLQQPTQAQSQVQPQSQAQPPAPRPQQAPQSQMSNKMSGRRSSIIQPSEIAGENGPVIKRVIFPKLEGPN